MTNLQTHNNQLPVFELDQQPYQPLATLSSSDSVLKRKREVLTGQREGTGTSRDIHLPRCSMQYAVLSVQTDSSCRFKRPPRCEAVVDADMSRRLNQING